MGVALAGLLRDSSSHLWKEPSLRGVPTTLIDTRYAAVLRELRDLDAVCWRTDEPLGTERAGRRFFDALYALAPRTLVTDCGHLRHLLVDPSSGPPRLESR
jgi:hypothetical protein